jgi:hypothetical protein
LISPSPSASPNFCPLSHPTRFTESLVDCTGLLHFALTNHATGSVKLCWHPHRSAPIFPSSFHQPFQEFKARCERDMSPPDRHFLLWTRTVFVRKILLHDQIPLDPPVAQSVLLPTGHVSLFGVLRGHSPSLSPHHDPGCDMRRRVQSHLLFTWHALGPELRLAARRRHSCKEADKKLCKPSHKRCTLALLQQMTSRSSQCGSQQWLAMQRRSWHGFPR